MAKKTGQKMKIGSKVVLKPFKPRGYMPGVVTTIMHPEPTDLIGKTGIVRELHSNGRSIVVRFGKGEKIKEYYMDKDSVILKE